MGERCPIQTGFQCTFTKENAMENKSMRISIYGSRGSINASRPDSVGFGGHTTSLRIESDCIPKDTAMLLDAGSGVVEAMKQSLKEGLLNVAILFTHWHFDHVLGLFMGAHTHHPKAKLRIWGPVEHGFGPSKVFETLMAPPFFPRPYAEVRSRFQCENLENVGTEVMVVHPEGGFHKLPLHVFEKAERDGKQLSLGKNRYPIAECLVIKMHKAAHPDYTISYRIEERPTGKVFVFLTDHENTDGLPMALRQHVQGANLLIQDCQYLRARYDKFTAGFGHGTPDYCAKLATTCSAQKLGLTHHDPDASDEDIRNRLEEVKKAARDLGNEALVENIFACADFTTIEV